MSVIHGDENDNRYLGESSAFGVENYFYGHGGNDTIEGGFLANNYLYGGIGNDILSGGGILDRLYGEDGDDTLDAWISSDVELFGGRGNDWLRGSTDTGSLLDGGVGVDELIGGDGGDIYVIDNVGDVIREAFVPEFDNVYNPPDKVRSSISFSLTDVLENLALTGSAAINGTGNGANNAITGNSAANILDGGAGNDVLNGGAGADTLTGGSGNDTYVVDTSADKVTEETAKGVDLVQSSITLALGNNLENLTLIGAAAINAKGNSLANVLTGNSAANVLNGGLGADTMAGGSGNDNYIVDNASDKVREAVEGGVDVVQSSVSYLLSTEVEHLKLTGSAAINGTGNSLANRLTGNGAANVLDGGAGNDYLNGGLGGDTMKGGAGDDLYVVDSAADRVIESSSTGGLDRVETSLSYTLGTYVENLTLTGTGHGSGTGNNLANRILGNSGSNSLEGWTGNDRLEGGAGSDRLSGGVGNDVLKGDAGVDKFIFGTSNLSATNNVDTILDFSETDDQILLDRDVFSAFSTDGRIAGVAFYAGTGAHDADDRIIYDQSSGKIFYDRDGNGGAAQILFAKVTAGTELTSLDFITYTG